MGVLVNLTNHPAPYDPDTPWIGVVSKASERGIYNRAWPAGQGRGGLTGGMG